MNEQPLMPEQLARLKTYGGYPPTGEDEICARCGHAVSVHNGCDWTDGDLCDSCAQEILSSLLPLLPQLIVAAELRAGAEQAVQNWKRELELECATSQQLRAENNRLRWLLHTVQQEAKWLDQILSHPDETPALPNHPDVTPHSPAVDSLASLSKEFEIVRRKLRIERTYADKLHEFIKTEIVRFQEAISSIVSTTTAGETPALPNRPDVQTKPAKIEN